MIRENCLRDQETGKAVSVMEYSSFCRLLSTEQRGELEQFCSMKTKESGEWEFLQALHPRLFALYQCGMPGRTFAGGHRRQSDCAGTWSQEAHHTCSYWTFQGSAFQQGKL